MEFGMGGRIFSQFAARLANPVGGMGRLGRIACPCQRMRHGQVEYNLPMPPVARLRLGLYQRFAVN